MARKYSLTFRAAEAPISEFVTKFGGQPTWWDAPQWPISRSTGEPMRFIGQFALHAALFGAIPGRMAYFFLTDGETFVDNTYDPEGGENALIIQPGRYEGLAQPLAMGPTLGVEYAVALEPGEDPDQLDENMAHQQGHEGWDAFTEHWRDQKIGGTPAFLENEEYPRGGPWRLLFQLDETGLPFSVNFGVGIGYGFLSADGQQGKFLWQRF